MLVTPAGEKKQDGCDILCLLSLSYLQELYSISFSAGVGIYHVAPEEHVCLCTLCMYVFAQHTQEKRREREKKKRDLVQGSGLEAGEEGG